MFEKTREIGPFGDARQGVYLVAGSFEPRSIRSTQILVQGVCNQSVVFNYEDNLDNTSGIRHTEFLMTELAKKTSRSPFKVRCKFSDPYSAVRSFSSFISREDWSDRQPNFTIDATCFTKIHLLLLLKFISVQFGSSPVRICYTEPLSYATSYNKQLSYGIERTVYLPYQVAGHASKGVGLVAFLGHERLRLERIIQELEPDVTIVILGEPGFPHQWFSTAEESIVP